MFHAVHQQIPKMILLGGGKKYYYCYPITPVEFVRSYIFLLVLAQLGLCSWDTYFC